jgi:3'-5' exoribonuclease
MGDDLRPLDLRQLRAGARVQHVLMVRERSDKVARNGKAFAFFRVGNASGDIGTFVWEEHLDRIQGVAAGALVQLIGEVESRDGKLQLRLSGPPAVIPSASLGDAEIVAQFLPRIAQREEDLWDRIDGWIAAMPATLRRAAEVVFRDDPFRVDFARTPGATKGHHARIGGLLLHTCEVAEIARASVGTMGGDIHLVTAGALLHDIGKVRAYAVDLRGFEYTAAGHLLGHIVLGSMMLDERLRTLPAGSLSETQRLELHHFIQSHHGIPEFGAAVRPMTLEAEVLHYADQSSAKGNDFAEAVEDTELFPSDDLAFSAKRSWRLERRVWKRTHRWE